MIVQRTDRSRLVLAVFFFGFRTGINGNDKAGEIVYL